MSFIIVRFMDFLFHCISFCNIKIKLLFVVVELIFLKMTELSSRTVDEQNKVQPVFMQCRLFLLALHTAGFTLTLKKKNIRIDGFGHSSTRICRTRFQTLPKIFHNCHINLFDGTFYKVSWTNSLLYSS